MNTVSGYTTVWDGVKHGLPFIKTIDSLIETCDEVVVVVANPGSDETFDVINNRYLKGEIKLYAKNLPDSPTFDGEIKQYARNFCTKDICIQLDADEYFHEDSVPFAFFVGHHYDILDIGDCLSSHQFNFWGPDHGDISIKWRFTKNLPHIIHDQGRIPGSDGCFMIDSRDGQCLPLHVPSQEAVKHFTLPPLAPLVIHESGKDLFRKMKMARDFWADRWDRLRQRPSVEATFFGEVRGKTDEEILEMSKAVLKRGLTDGTAVRVPKPAFIK